MLGASLLDWYSTVIQGDYRVEENPVIRWVWEHTGSFGFLAYKLLLLAFFIFLLQYVGREIRIIMSLFFIILTTAIALTNLAVIDYSWTSWII